MVATNRFAKTCQPSLAFFVVVVVLGGCTALSPEEAFVDVQTKVEQRIGKRVNWEPSDGTLSPASAIEIQGLLAQPLTWERAIRVALLNNRDLQALYADVGIAYADLVQAGLLKNPTLNGSVTFVEAGGPTNLVLSLAVNIIDSFYRRLRERVALHQLEETKLRVVGRILDVAGETMFAFIEYQAQLQLVEVLEGVVRAQRAAVDAARALREAGNITELDLESQRTLISQVSLDLAAAQAAGAPAREKLNVLMGLFGSQTQWRAHKRLPSLPAKELPVADAERRAIEASLDLAQSEQGLLRLAHQYNLVDKKAIIPSLDLGVDAERKERVWEVGPSYAIELPLFDRGDAKRAKAVFEIEQARGKYTALAVRIRSEARLTRAQVLTTRKTARYIQSVVVPQNASVVRITQANYNAMQVGIFQLLAARRQEITSGQLYVNSLANYWRARARLMLLMSGRLPPPEMRLGQVVVTGTSAPSTGAQANE
jgi:cobalt-zinc-cadmium efflux system outer membrane protein